jgi:hypothetical protein
MSDYLSVEIIKDRLQSTTEAAYEIINLNQEISSLRRLSAQVADENLKLREEVEELQSEHRSDDCPYCENKALREGLKRLQYAASEYCCIYEHTKAHLHEPLPAEHYLTCLGCGNPKCTPCEPDCWLAKLIGGGK